MRAIPTFAIAGFFAGLAALIPPAEARARVCKPAVSAVGHGQAVEPSQLNFGVAFARRDARKKLRAAVKSADGQAYARLSRAKHVSYTEDRGAGQIYITLKAAPCK